MSNVIGGVDRITDEQMTSLKSYIRELLITNTKEELKGKMAASKKFSAKRMKLVVKIIDEI